MGHIYKNKYNDHILKQSQAVVREDISNVFRPDWNVQIASYTEGSHSQLKKKNYWLKGYLKQSHPPDIQNTALCFQNKQMSSITFSLSNMLISYWKKSLQRDQQENWNAENPKPT